MPVKIALRLRGIDLRSTDEYLRIPSELTDLQFEATGPISCALLATDDADPVWVATQAARRIVKHLSGVVVTGVYDELVPKSDIAARCGLGPEAVRLWTTGQRRRRLRPFPAPQQVISFGSAGKTMNLYAWREVVLWVREVIGFDPDEGVDFLTDAQQADLNAQLHAVGDFASVDAMTSRFTRTNDVAVFVSHHGQDDLRQQISAFTFGNRFTMKRAAVPRPPGRSDRALL
jgi:hypothetical protein